MLLRLILFLGTLVLRKPLSPDRPTFDASSRTSKGSSLNDCLAKGDAPLVDMMYMMFNWLIGPNAVTGDISQFYNTVLLDEQHWEYQQVYWYDDLDPNNPLRRGVVVTLIYGVRCVKGQTEEIMGLVAEPHKETLPCCGESKDAHSCTSASRLEIESVCC